MGKWIDYTQVSSVADDDTIMINGKNLATKQALLSELNQKITELESGSSGGSGVTSTMASTLWAIIQKCAFATALTDTEKNAFKTAWGITDSSSSSGGSSSGGSSSGGSTDTPSTPTSYSVTKNLTNCSISNSSTTVTAGSSYTATITANTNCELGTVTVTMGGVSQTVTNGVVNITSVTGDIVINATATSTNVFKTEYEEYKDSWLWVENQYVSADDGTLTDKTNLKTYKVTPPSWATHYLVMIARTSSDLNITGRMGCIYGDKYIMSSGQSVYGRTKTYDFESISADASNAYIQPIISGSSSIFFSVEANQTFSGIHWIKYPTLEDGSTPVENKLYLINYEYESGQLNGTTGSIEEHTYFGTTNYINVSDFDYVKMARAEQISWNYAFYDLSKAYVSGANGDFRTGSFDIPSGVTFGRFSARSTSAYKAIGSNYAYNALKPIYFAKSEVTE